MSKRESILALYAEGKKQAEIGPLVGCSHQYVSQVIKMSRDQAWAERYREKNSANSKAYYHRRKALLDR